MVAICCGLRPGLSRFALILLISTGFPRIVERATEVLRIWPPPSPYDPSMTTKFVMLLHPSVLILAIGFNIADAYAFARVRFDTSSV